MITSVLVANRGEIARRVFATCRRLGISTVAVHSDPDALGPHVLDADSAVALPGSSAAETYLDATKIIAAAEKAGAAAIHPGYGFLSENAEFAQAVLDAGLIWIGPPPAAIAAMGSKVAAKRLMAAAGVPVLDQLDPDAVSEADLPILIKASAGGGGKGMRVVRELPALPAELAAARHEAQSSFGDPAVFCEPYLATGRHIEVQILADEHGTVLPMGERECSLQRRHQKVVEEAPSPLVERIPGMRDRLFEAAVAAAKAVDYVGAGTVEFLADADGRFFFLEMNTRLQVEHPVTECTTGEDLVRWQIAIAEGAALPPEAPPVRGHAIEARLYAEDPGHDWRPSTGTVHRFQVPGVTAEFGTLDSAGIRLDAGVIDGSVVSIYYDPMLAKVIAWAPDRMSAARSLSAALARTRVHGVVTNRDLLVRVLRDPAFLAGDIDTSYLEQRVGELAKTADTETTELSAVAAALAGSAANRAQARVLRSLPSGWRSVVSQPQRVEFSTPEGAQRVEYRFVRGRAEILGRDDISVVELSPDLVRMKVGSVVRPFEVARYPDLVVVDSPLGSVSFELVPRFPEARAKAAPGSLLAPMPATVISVEVTVGTEVAAGDPLVQLEAMKMQQTITAPGPGIVTALPVGAGQQVAVGEVLVVLSPTDQSAPIKEEDA